jgi:hypothetical protein
MPMSTSNASMFPPSSFSYEDTSNACFQSTGVRPRPHWTTTEYGGYVSRFQSFSSVRTSPSLETSCRESTRCSRGSGATSSSPTECETRGAEAGRSICPSQFRSPSLHIYIVSVSVSDGVWVYCSTTTRVLKNISSSIVALVMEKGEHGNLRRRKKKKKM